MALADTHLFHDKYVVPDGDVLVHAGDLCRHGTREELERALDWLSTLPHPYKVLVAGNHDRLFEEQPVLARSIARDVCYLQDEGAIIDGLHLWGSPWQPQYNNWAFNLPRGEKLDAIWKTIPLGLDVLVTHGPPAGIGDRSPAAERAGCQELRFHVERAAPRIHLFGHIHQDGGVWRVGNTVFANVSSCECERAPTVIDIDTNEITIISAPRADSFDRR